MTVVVFYNNLSVNLLNMFLKLEFELKMFMAVC